MQQHNMSWIEVCNSNRFSEFFDTADEEHNFKPAMFTSLSFRFNFSEKQWMYCVYAETHLNTLMSLLSISRKITSLSS